MAVTYRIHKRSTKTLTKLKPVLLLIILYFLFCGCSKDVAGPVGPQGEKGTNGTTITTVVSSGTRKVYTGSLSVSDSYVSVPELRLDDMPLIGVYYSAGVSGPWFILIGGYTGGYFELEEGQVWFHVTGHYKIVVVK